MKYPITEILGQAWFDHLSEYYDIGEFPPLHSLTFGEWCLIIDEKDNILSNERLLTTKTYSFNNDIWTIIEEDEKPLYSDIVRSTSSIPFNYQQYSSPQNKKINNHYESRMMNDQLGCNTHDYDDNDDDLWLLFKSPSHHRLKHKKNHILNQTSDSSINTVHKKKKKEKRSRNKNHQTHFVRHQRKHTHHLKQK